MKNTAACAQKFRALLKKLEKGQDLTPASDGDPVSTLIYSSLLWEATVSDATTAFDKLVKSVVDYNELRVLLAHDVIDIIGEDYPKADERARRLRAMLRDIYVREHEVTLGSLSSLGKKDTKIYLDTLEGMVSFVSSRIQLLHYEGRGIPVDEQLRELLVEESAVDASAKPVEITNWITRQIKVEQDLEVAGQLQRWSDNEAQRQRRNAARRVTRKKPVSTTTSKKTTAKKTASKKTVSKKTVGKKAVSKKAATKKTSTVSSGRKKTGTRKTA
ncbi:MAG: hypothetical protein P8J86_03805 [Phycisphaerales bacterium]|nr:hypothetical protein [Phycisphaerales bacterium]